jgi:ribose-phosphate pyrophosphokinase
MNRVEILLGGTAYTKFKYPAGEMQVRLTEETANQVAEATELIVVARITSLEQVIELCLLSDAIRSTAPDKARLILILPYLPFARADRRFTHGDCFGLHVFAKLLSTTDAQLVTLDVHSAAAQQELSRLVNVSPLPLISEAVATFARKHRASRIAVLFPDEGARKRYQLPNKLDGISIDVLHCSKKRDAATGKLNAFAVPALSEFPNESGQLCPVIIVDDICDGGGTFVGIADELKDYGLTLALYVTHGIFAKGFDHLQKRFSSIYTTDSFCERESTELLHVISSLPLLTTSSLIANGIAASH